MEGDTCKEFTECTPNCEKCLTKNECGECNESFDKTRKGKCECPTEMILNSETERCELEVWTCLDDNCLECSKDGVCLICSGEYLLSEEGTCEEEKIVVIDEEDPIVWPPESGEVTDDNENENAKDDETESILDVDGDIGGARLEVTSESDESVSSSHEGSFLVDMLVIVFCLIILCCVSFCLWKCLQI